MCKGPEAGMCLVTSRIEGLVAKVKRGESRELWKAGGEEEAGYGTPTWSWILFCVRWEAIGEFYSGH